MPDLRSEKAHLKQEKSNWRPERPDLKPEMPDQGEGNGWMDRRTNKQKSPCVLQDLVPFRATAQKMAGLIQFPQFAVFVPLAFQPFSQVPICCCPLSLSFHSLALVNCIELYLSLVVEDLTTGCWHTLSFLQTYLHLCDFIAFFAFLVHKKRTKKQTQNKKQEKKQKQKKTNQKTK